MSRRRSGSARNLSIYTAAIFTRKGASYSDLDGGIEDAAPNSATLRNALLRDPKVRDE